jgi:alpha-D-ribose 1-methylphosphonate 5-phosphate C-P lyase
MNVRANRPGGKNGPALIPARGRLELWLRDNPPGRRIAAGHRFAFLDETTKREIRRKTLKAVAIPGYQVPFGSRELPIARGWGTGGIQLTLSLIGPKDILKVIDQGCDDSVNAVNIKKFVEQVTGVTTIDDTSAATLIQTRHRIPEQELRRDQILILQVPIPEPLRNVEPSEEETRRMHGEADYSSMWLRLYEDIVKYKDITIGSRYPVLVNRRHIMDPSPIPRWDVPRLNQAKTLFLFGAGREKRIYAVPPFTDVRPLEFADYHFRVENFPAACSLCGSRTAYLDEIVGESSGEKSFTCSDTFQCKSNRAKGRETL